MSRPRVLITGAGGQVGSELFAAAPDAFEVHSATRSELDIGDRHEVERVLAEIRPQLVINAAAYTAVDKAESEPALALRVNAEGAANLARGLVSLNEARMLHVSTDFVFDGRKSTAYSPADSTNPLGVYGQTKLAGERAVLATLGERAAVVRTSWVYAAQGRNFLHTMLRLLNERGVVRVVADQIGTPTSARSLASTLWLMAQHTNLRGTYHFTDAGVASWYDFAVAIAEEGAACGLIKRAVEVVPIATSEYPTPAKRPAFSVLDKSALATALGLVPVHWRVNLRRVLAEMSRA